MVTDEKEYKEKLNSIDALMKKGEENLTDEDVKLLEQMTSEVYLYENKYIILPTPKTIREMVELKLFEKKMSQAEFARRSGLAIPKVNQILKGKRNIDVSFLKAVYSELNISADFLLSAI